MDAFLGEIRPFAFNFSPRNWMPCQGQLLPISQYSTLFSILGTQYGGNGQTNFQLPNLQASVALGSGRNSLSGTTYDTGDAGGASGVQLVATEIPMHTHTLNGKTGGGALGPVQVPTNTTYLCNVAARATESATTGVLGRTCAPATSTPNASLNPNTVGVTGGGQAHNNMMPYLAITYCICINGVFPQRP